MAILSTSWYLDITVVTLTLLTVSYLYFKHLYSYWTRHGVKSLPPTFPFGNFRDVFLMRKPFGKAVQELHLALEGEKMGGVYQLFKPTLILRDLELIKQVFVKDAHIFNDRGVFHDEERDPLTANLFTISGPKWKFTRAKLTPTFTSGKMKMMFHTLSEVGDKLKTTLDDIVAKDKVVEVNDLLARFSTDVIASVAFGIDCNCLKDPDSEFRQRGRQFFQRGALGNLGMALNFLAPNLGRLSGLGVTPKLVSEFFTRVVKETVDYREKNNVKRNDMMQMMIQLKNDGFVEGDENWEKESMHKISMKDVTAQAFVFYVAGFETSSTTMTFALYELALNPDIQQRLRKEIDDTLAQTLGGKLTYEAMESMEFLHMVTSETLRKYPPLGFLNRECGAAYTPAGSELRIDAGVQVMVSVYALHHDQLHYPEPDRFEPARFAKEARAKRNPFVYMPFGVGPRNCIGARFGLMQVKVGLITLLRHFEFSVSSRTPIPIVLDPAMILMSPKGGMPLTITPRRQ